jgi:DnaD/phage-associated family protein
MPAEPSAAPADALPATILLRLVREVWSPMEVKVVLAVAALGGLSTPVREERLLLHDELLQGARGDGSDRPSGERIFDAIDMAAVRGVVLRLADETETRWLLLGTDENRRRARARRITSSPDAGWRGTLALERPSIFTLYEQNVGLVTPIIADRLIEALERYPEAWIEDAISEAVSYNRRSWRYIQRILENWATEGRTDEVDRRGTSRDLTRNKHLRGKYAHLFRRDDVPDL